MALATRENVVREPLDGDAEFISKGLAGKATTKSLAYLEAKTRGQGDV